MYVSMVYHRMDDLIINVYDRGFTGGIDEDSEDSTSSYSIKRPSRRRLLTIDSHLQIANDIQYSGAL